MTFYTGDAATDLAIKIVAGVFIFLFGLCIGSFSNVLIYRLPLNLGISKGNSFCPNCKHKLSPADLVPLFSWIFLGGKCRYCKVKIPVRYPLVELLTAVFYVLCYIFIAKCSLNLALLGLCAVCTALIVASFIDAKHQIIPDSMWITVLIGGVLVYIEDIIKNGFVWKALLNRIIGFFLVSAVMLVLAAAFHGGLGGGDIKLMAAAGFLLGAGGSVFALLLGSVLGLFYLAAKGKLNAKNMKSKLPFGPFLSIGIVFSLFFGDRLLSLYMSIWK
ncbi:MAG: prepilin peptidase [Candidatus Fimenecus sp.]